MMKHVMSQVLRPASLVIVAVAAGCGGDDSSSIEVVEQEPNDERVGANKLPDGGGDFVITGTCEDSNDNDNYDAKPAIAGPYTVRLEWEAGNYDLMFDPEDGFSGSQSQSMTPPITASGQVVAGAVQFNIDCYNENDPPTLAGLAYTVHLTLP